MREMDFSEFTKQVDEKAKQIHEINGHVLNTYGRELYPVWGPVIDKYIDLCVRELAQIYCHEYAAYYIEKSSIKYAIAPNKPNGYIYERSPFEALWFVRGLLGLSIARQAVIIHQEPSGKEPIRADENIKKKIRSYLKHSNPEIIREIMGDADER